MEQFFIVGTFWSIMSVQFVRVILKQWVICFSNMLGLVQFGLKVIWVGVLRISVMFQCWNGLIMFRIE